MAKPVAMITGAASGLGLATARALAEDHQLVVADLSVKKLDALATELRGQGAQVQTLACDVSQRQDVDRLVAMAVSTGNLKTVFHAAGVSPNQSDAKSIYRINLVGTAYVLEALTPHMAQGATAVCVASQASYLFRTASNPDIDTVLESPLDGDVLERLAVFSDSHQVFANRVAYGLSKLGVRLLVEKLAPLWGKSGARIVSISPGMIETPMAHLELASNPKMQIILDETPLGRVGQPEDIANVVRFLCSTQASFISGVDLLVDGGSTHAVMRGVREGRLVF